MSKSATNASSSRYASVTRAKRTYTRKRITRSPEENANLIDLTSVLANEEEECRVRFSSVDEVLSAAGVSDEELDAFMYAGIPEEHGGSFAYPLKGELEIPSTDDLKPNKGLLDESREARAQPIDTATPTFESCDSSEKLQHFVSLDGFRDFAVKKWTDSSASRGSKSEPSILLDECEVTARCRIPIERYEKHDTQCAWKVSAAIYTDRRTGQSRIYKLEECHLAHSKGCFKHIEKSGTSLPSRKKKRKLI